MEQESHKKEYWALNQEREPDFALGLAMKFSCDPKQVAPPHRALVSTPPEIITDPGQGSVMCKI